MTCPCEKPNHKKMCKAGTPPVLEVHSEECPVLFHTVVIPASAGDPTTMPPEPGMYRNVRLTYEATGDSYLFDSDGIPQYLANKGIVDSVNGKIGVVVLNAADVNAQAPLTAGANIAIDSDNVISATDTTYTAGTNVSIDSDNVISATNTTYTAGANVTIDSDNVISATDTTYTAGANITIDANNEISATNTTYTAGTNVSIDPDNVISATDTTYSNFVGTDGVDSGSNGLVPAPSAADASKFLKADGTWAVTPDTTYTHFTGTDGNTDGTAGLVPAPVTTDAGKFLKADGTWDTAGSSITLYTTTGQHTDGAMTQKATTNMVFNNGATSKINIGGNTSSQGTNSVSIGGSSIAGTFGVAIGNGATTRANSNYSVAIGNNARNGNSTTASTSLGYYADTSTYDYSVALGAFSKVRAQGVVDVSSVYGGVKHGYQGADDATRTEYRVISGVHAGEDEHDAAIVGQVVKCVYSTSAPTNTTVGVPGTFLIYTYSPQPNVTQIGLFVCTTADTNVNYYEWRQLF